MKNTRQEKDNCVPSMKVRIGRRQALAKLGLAATAVYLAPALMPLNDASASRGGGGSGGGRSGGGGSGAAVLIVGDATTEKECGECHEPYAPRNLPSGSWQKIMNNLDNHFGEDASLEDAKRQKITNFLVSNAGGRGDGPLRITDTNWFTRKHSGKNRRGGKSMASCKSCHAPNPGSFRNRRW